MDGYGGYSAEAEARAEYEIAKRKMLEQTGPLAPLGIIALWVIREQTIRRMRKGRRVALHRRRG